jgi:CheY-like chemotaxis protein
MGVAGYRDDPMSTDDWSPIPESPAPTDEERPSEALHERLRILVVEDNAEHLALLRMMLEMMGHAVEGADDGNAGLKMATSLRPDVALVDIGLPGLDGCTLAERLRAIDPDERLWLVAITGHGRPEDKARALDAGFDHYVLKPVDEIALQRALALRSAPRGA